MLGLFHILGLLITVTSFSQVSCVRFYRLPPTFKLTSKEVDHVTTNSVWTCFANAESYDPEWTHFYFDASSSRCSLRDGLISFDFTALSPTGTEAGKLNQDGQSSAVYGTARVNTATFILPEAPLPGNFYVKDVAGLLAGVDGCPAEIVLRDLVCALPQPLPPRPADCNALESLVLITSANETALTNALFRGKCNDHGPDFYAATCRRLVVDVLWNETLTVAQRMEQAAVGLDSVADDEDSTKEDFLAFPVGGWGTICDFLACTKLRFPSAAIKLKNCASSGATGAMATADHRIFCYDDDPEADDPDADNPQTANPQANDPQANDPQAYDPQAYDPQAYDPQADDPQADNSADDGPEDD